MNNLHNWVLHKVPIWMSFLLMVGFTVFTQVQVNAQSVELEDITVQELYVQPGACIAQTSHWVTRNYDNFYFYGVVPLTGNLNLVIDSEVDIAFCALAENKGTLTVLPGTIQDNSRALDTLKLTGLIPCDTVFFEVKSYDFTIGTEIRACLYEPPLEVTCGKPVTLTDSNAGDKNDYKPYERTATVICPDDLDKKFISLTFNQFDLQERDSITGYCKDYFQILDGNSLRANPIEIDGKTRFCGDELQSKLVFANNWPNGCVTVVFNSNSDTIVGAGFQLTADCSACNLNFDATVTENCLGGTGKQRRVDISPTGGSGVYQYQFNGGAFQDVGTFLTSTTTFPLTVTIQDKNDHACKFTKTIKDDSKNLSIVFEKIIPTDCDGKNGGFIVKAQGGALPYQFSITGTTLQAQQLNDSLYAFRNLSLDQLDPVTGIPLSRSFQISLSDNNGCLTQGSANLYSSCYTTRCGEGISSIVPSSENTLFICSQDKESRLVLDTFSIGNPNRWLVNDTAIVHIFEGQGFSGKLLASYSRANPPQPSDFPLFTRSGCLTIFIENDRIGEIDNRFRIETSCAACDYAVDVVEQNADCQNTSGKAFIQVLGDSDYTITLEGSFPLYQREVVGGEVLEVSGLLEGRYQFKIVENWFHCTQYVTVDIGKDSGPQILKMDVANETCDKQSNSNASAVITVTGGSGKYLYSISGDTFGSRFFDVPLDGSAGDKDPRRDTVAFVINNLEGNGYLTNLNSYSLVVKDANLTASNCKDEATLEVGDNCFNKQCGGTFYDHPADAHVMAIDPLLSEHNYDDYTPFTAVICPDVRQQFVTVRFDTFHVAIGDTLRVYDSTAIATQPSLLIGEFTGFGLNNRSVTAKNPSGCLTFQFTPNGDKNTEIGWFGTIECNAECDLTLDKITIRKETCETANDGSIQLDVSGGSGKRTFSIRPFGTAPRRATVQKENIFEDLAEGLYIVRVRDDLLPNCNIIDTLEVDRHPPIRWTVKSPGLTCGAVTSTVTIIPHGGSGEYKITPAGIEAHSRIVLEGQEFSYNLTGAGSFQFKISDAANSLDCYHRFQVDVNDNCRFTCYENEQFSSNPPYDGSGTRPGSAGYENYEHVEMTYCPHSDDLSVKADFIFFDTEKDLDVLTIYHGKGTTGELIGVFSGNDNPGTIISTAADGCLTFAFETNLVDNNFDGFLADLSCVSCKLSATYTEVRGETFCWDAKGDQNGVISVAVDHPVATTYEFQLRDEFGNPLSRWMADNNDDTDLYADYDDHDDITKKGIDHEYVFGGLTNGTYIVGVRDAADRQNCMISLLPVVVEQVEQLEVEVQVTNANCQGAGGQVCITPVRGSGQYSFSDDNFSMFMNTACFDGLFGQTLTINVKDELTSCEVTVSATIGSDCYKTCGQDFFDDDGWDGIAGNADDGTALYGKNVDTTWIFCPTTDDKLIEIDFSDFLTSVEDTLTIIDGDGSGHLIGHYSGTNSPGLVRSTSGCLTVHFKSDEFIEKQGWEARVGCFYCPTDLHLTSNMASTCGHTGPVQLTANAAGYSNFKYSLDGVTWNNSTGYFGSIPAGTTKLYAIVDGLPNCITSIDYKPALSINVSALDASCTANTGRIAITAAGGSGAYDYQVNGTTIVGNALAGLAAGTYTVSVYDKNDVNCFHSQTVRVGKEICAPVTSCVKINAFVYLEGAHRPGGIMHTDLNDKGYLPGQKPNAFFGTPTIAGQPYNRAPWSYNGTEGAGFNYQLTGNNKAGYDPNVVDWVLVSLRSGTAKSTTVCRHAALLHKDGSIHFVAGHDCCQVDPHKSYYIVVEHRNHLIIMSPTPVPVSNGTLTYDFRFTDSYKSLFGVGQKKLPSGVYAMYCGNGDQTSSGSSDTNITTDDKNQWVRDNGSNSAYFYPDFDMNGDVNVTDKSVWLDNNGKACDVPNN